MSEVELSTQQIDEILSPARIRQQATAVFNYTEKGLGFFEISEAQFRPTVDFVIKVIRQKYPSLEIPFHSRWGHFRAGEIDRPKKLKALLGELDPMERARTELDLVITSVLLDAGAGAGWSYQEESTGQKFDRSEGLGVASFHMFLSGVMSDDRESLRADVDGLKKTTARDLKKYFQVSDANPLVGIEGRVALLNGLGRAVENQKIFKDGRPGNIIDYLVSENGKTVPAPAILRAVLDGLGVIWPGRLVAKASKKTINLGDVWRHSKLGGKDEFASLVPLHKLSQWMSYSLIEPMVEAGLKVTNVQGLTGLAEYRNGGLLIDMDLIRMKDPSNLKKEWRPDSDLVIEWRALTVYFLDRVGAEVQKALGKTPEEFPLAKVLEGGTWWAGRYIAKEKRASADPPLRIVSDGTVF